MKPIPLIIEKSQGELWGRVLYEDNLMVDSAKTLSGLQRKMKKLLKDFHQLDTKEVNFDYSNPIC